MSNAPFPIDPHRSAISLAYKNTAYIADGVLPRVFVGKQEFKFYEYPIEESFTLPDTKVGRKGQPNQIDLTATERQSATQDYGLEDPIPLADILNAAENHDPLDRAVEQLTDYILLDREKRCADLVFDATQYPASNKITLSGTSQFNDFTNSDPIGVVSDGVDSCLMKPNVMVMGQAVYKQLSQHPDVIKAVHGTSGDKGIARRSAIAELFEMEDVLVGSSWLNTANKGQTATLSRVWGKHLLMLHRNQAADTRGGLTFGFSAQWGDRIAGAETDSSIGLRGGQRVRVGESLKEIIVATQAAYFVENAVA